MFDIKENEVLRCSAGFSYFHINPDGNIYRCMGSYSDPPIMHISEFSKQELINRFDSTCYKKACCAGCDRDWADKWIVCENEIKEHIKSEQFCHVFEEQKLDRFDKDNVKIVWSPTMSCNYNCSYCENNIDDNTENIDEEIKNGFLNIKGSFNSGIIDISGGEPFIKLSLVTDVIESLQDKFKFAITTNLGFSILEFSRKINPEKINLSLSIHPTSKQFDFDIFLGRCLLLKECGFDFKINFVGYPEQLYLFDRYKQIFDSYSIHIELLPWVYGGRCYKPGLEYRQNEIDYVNSRSRLPEMNAVSQGRKRT